MLLLWQFHTAGSPKFNLFSHSPWWKLNDFFLFQTFRKRGEMCWKCFWTFLLLIMQSKFFYSNCYKIFLLGHRTSCFHSNGKKDLKIVNEIENLQYNSLFFCCLNAHQTPDHWYSIRFSKSNDTLTEHLQE